MIIYSAISNAWIVESGKYKYSASCMFLDKESTKATKLQYDYYKKLLKIEYTLYQMKKTIMERYNNSRVLSNGGLTWPNSVQERLDKIDADLETIAAEKTKYAGNEYKLLSKFEVEYGIQNSNSMGIIIGYDMAHFDQKHHYGNSAELYFKQLLWKNDDFLITISPHIEFVHHHTANEDISLGGSLFIAHSSCKDKRCRYRELGLKISRTVNKISDRKEEMSISLQEGITLTSGFSLTNFSEITKETPKKITRNITKKYRFFNQISVAKTFDFASLGNSNLTLQLGYFWKGNLRGNQNTLSGPTISLWFII